MSDLDQLHESRTVQPISDEEFIRGPAGDPEEEADDETAARILAAEAEEGETISHAELKQRLGI
jgi:hypothetical protein